MPHVLPLSLRGRRPGRIRPELGPLRRALAELGEPQLSFPSLLVVGTNGKGSTAALLESVFEAHGVATGCTTSPHLVDVGERIRVRGRPLPPDRLEGYLERLAVFDDLTFFETITAAAFLAFAGSAVDLAILEAGMGGTWDATRTAGSVIAGCTNIGSDHAGWLGDEPADRARDKGAALAAAECAVIGPGVTAELIPSLGAPRAVAARELVEVAALTGDRVRIVWDRHTLEIDPPLVGAHQLDNLQLALAMARCAEAQGLVPRLEPAAVAAGLAGVRLPGRLTRHRLVGREVLVDCAHNLEGALALAHHLEGLDGRHNLLFSCLDDKDVGAMARVLEPVVGEVAICELADERAMPIARLKAAYPGAASAPDPVAALGLLPDPVVVAGSLRLVGALLEVAEEEARQ